MARSHNYGAYLVGLVEEDAALGGRPSQPLDHLIQAAHLLPTLRFRTDIVGEEEEEGEEGDGQ